MKILLKNWSIKIKNKIQIVFFVRMILVFCFYNMCVSHVELSFQSFPFVSSRVSKELVWDWCFPNCRNADGQSSNSSDDKLYFSTLCRQPNHQTHTWVRLRVYIERHPQTPSNKQQDTMSWPLCCNTIMALTKAHRWNRQWNTCLDGEMIKKKDTFNDNDILVF